MNLRLLGVTCKSVPVSEFTSRRLPWTRGAFAGMVITGLLIFYANPARYYHNIFLSHQARVAGHLRLEHMVVPHPDTHACHGVGY